MKILNASIHGILDYATVIVFASADMPLGLVKIIPMRLHALVEMLVGPTLIAAAFLAPTLVLGAQVFFIASGVAICAVWLFSDYASATQSD
jgi:hypothetical protein